MWARLRGVSMVLGKILSREFTVAELATQQVTPDQIRALKTATGRKINNDAIASLLAVYTGSAEHAVKLVSGLQNITPAVAAVILGDSGGLPRLCTQPIPLLAAVQLPQKTRTVRLGKVRAERIQRILNYKEGPATPAAPPARPATRKQVLADLEVEEVLSAAGFT